MESFLYVFGAVLVAGVLLYAAIARLLKTQAATPAELDAVSAERDRLAADLQAEREVASENATRVGKLSGLLEATVAESENKDRRIDEINGALNQARFRIEEETISARTASSAVIEREGTITELREAARLEREIASEKVSELTRMLEEARSRIETETIAARTASSALSERDSTISQLRESAQVESDEKISSVAELTRLLEEARSRIETETIAARTASTALRERDIAIAEMRESASSNSQELTRLQNELQALHTEHAGAKANLVHSQRAHDELKVFVAEAQSKLTGAFAELAGKVFDEKAQMFEKNVQAAGAQSKTDIDSLLKPFAERLGEFRQRVDTLYGEEAKERAALFGVVTELKSLNQDMATQTSALTRALKGSAKVRGDWGELMLESVLRGSGLEEGSHYDRQQSSTDDEGQRLRPDIVVRLPDDRRIVVDSKVNLVAWVEAMNAESPELQREAIQRHSVALRQHVKDLGEKNYPKSLGASALEITVAFVPIEGALSGALGFDSTLQAYAFEQRVVFASPNTLMALLGVVERLWTRDKIQRRAIEISDAGGKVLDALGRFLQEFDKVGSRLNGAHEAFSEARKFLTESNQAVIPRARRLAELGARGKKALHADLQPDVADAMSGLEFAEQIEEVISDPALEV